MTAQTGMCPEMCGCSLVPDENGNYDALLYDCECVGACTEGIDSESLCAIRGYHATFKSRREKRHGRPGTYPGRGRSKA
jgi:hypothetical protein